MKPTSSLTTSTQQQHQTVSIPPPLEAQLKSHLPATDVSFSSYLPRKKLDKSKSTSSPEEHLGSAPDDSELSIFNAQRYFSEGNQHDQVPGSSKRISPLEFRNLNLYKPSGFPRFSSASSIDGYGPGYRTRSLASSEASQNSQTGLLSSNARGVNSGARICGKEWSRIIPRWLLLPPKCLCAGKKSVQVKERTVDNHRVSAPREAASPKMPVEVRSSKVNMIPDSQEGFQNTVMGSRQPSSDSHFPSEAGRTHLMVSVPGKPLKDISINPSSGFTFPILPPPSISSSPPSPVTMEWSGSKFPPASPNGLLSPHLPVKLSQDALEVNKPPSDDFLVFRKSKENRTHYQQFKFLASFMSHESMAADDCDEVGSDASSDLFEIESISTQATYPTSPQKQRDSLNEVRVHIPLNKISNLDQKHNKDFSLEKVEICRQAHLSLTEA